MGANGAKSRETRRGCHVSRRAGSFKKVEVEKRNTYIREELMMVK